MEVYATEEQQVEALKKWFKRNGSTLIWCATLILLVIMGVRYYKHHVEVTKERASESYTQMLLSVSQGDEVTANSKAEQLRTNFNKTPYGALAGLYLAKAATEKGDLDSGATHLQWVIDTSPIQDFQLIARTRLARIYIAQEKFEEAMALFEVDDPDGFLTVLEELKGDIYHMNNNLDQAAQAYENAFRVAGDSTYIRPLLKMKLDEFGVASSNVNDENREQS